MKFDYTMLYITRAVKILVLVGIFAVGATYSFAAQSSCPKDFSLVKIGDTQEQVLQTLGAYRDSAVYTARNELDWNYVVCNNGRNEVHSVQFDTRTNLVTGSITTPDTINSSDAFPACSL